jgi:hypothetical protein
MGMLPCPQCGGVEQRDVAPGVKECVDCGLQSNWRPLVARAPEPGATPDPGAVARIGAVWDRMAQRFAAAPFAPYALDARWTGPRWFGGAGGAQGEHTRLEVAHGAPPDEDEPRVRIETSVAQRVGIGGPRDARLHRAMVVQQLLRHYAHEFGALPDDVRAAAFPRDSPVRIDPTAPWDDETIPVDTVPVPFRVLARQHTWLGFGQHDDRFVAIWAHRWPVADTGLVPVVDFAVYRAGLEAVAERMRRRHQAPPS